MNGGRERGRNSRPEETITCQSSIEAEQGKAGSP